jgi:hypothetical protein
VHVRVAPRRGGSFAVFAAQDDGERLEIRVNLHHFAAHRVRILQQIPRQHADHLLARRDHAGRARDCHPLLMLGQQRRVGGSCDWGRLRFTMAKDAAASLEVFDLQGRLVTTLFNGPAKTGDNEVTWDGRDRSGYSVANGVYFYRFQALDQDQTRKVVIVGWRN